MPTQLSARALSKSYNGHTVLDRVAFTIAPGERVGIIGENGSGKTTLLRLLAGREQPDSGALTVTVEGGTGYLAQEAPIPAWHTVQQVITGALSELRALEARLRQLESAMSSQDTRVLGAYGDLLTQFELRGGYDAEARSERALHGLGLAQLPRDRRVEHLSGGERARLRLAALLSAAPELLLLDEPTNHLDDPALSWLEDHLRQHQGTTVAVSHDRVFLERVTTSLLEVDADRHTLTRYGDGYAGYLAHSAARRQRWVQDHREWRQEVHRLREAAATTARRVAPARARTDGNKMAYDRAGGRVQQSLASRVRNAEERLRRALAAPVPPPPEPLRFTAPPPTATACGTLLDAHTMGPHGDSLALVAGERLLITGPNGAGKSTLLRGLARALAAHGVPTGHLPQETGTEWSGRTLLDAFAAGRPGHSDDHAQRLLAMGLFSQGRLTARVSELSTGQRRRLALARLLTAPADVLLLDEPTNHLSLSLVEDLEAAWNAYSGALVVVSHDRRLRERWRGTHLALSST